MATTVRYWIAVGVLSAVLFGLIASLACSVQILYINDLAHHTSGECEVLGCNVTTYSCDRRCIGGGLSGPRRCVTYRCSAYIITLGLGNVTRVYKHTFTSEDGGRVRAHNPYVCDEGYNKIRKSLITCYYNDRDPSGTISMLKLGPTRSSIAAISVSTCMLVVFMIALSVAAVRCYPR